MFTTPSGNPASFNIPPNNNVVPGVISEGFMTAVQPAAKAIGNFCEIINRGKFQGVIIPTTPTGTFCIMAVISLPTFVFTSPAICLAKVAA